jgi:hypothetical protein
MKKKRLLALADFLEKRVPPERFDMGCWLDPDWKGAQDLSCGASACALGWAPQVPALKKLKLYYRQPKDGYFEIRMRGVSYKGVKADGGDISMHTAVEAFGLSYTLAGRIFLPCEYKGHATPKGVAARIRNVVRRPKVWEKRNPDREVFS